MRQLRTFAVAASVAVIAGCGSSGSQSGSEPQPSLSPTMAPTMPTATPRHTTSATPTPTPTATQPRLPAWLSGAVVTRLPTTRRVVGLTFDGGAGAQGAATILRVLREAHVPATFFLTGDFVRAHPDIAVAIADGGYVIGNHTVTHPHLTRLTSDAVSHEITGAEQLLQTRLGQSPQPWFRFPYGEYDTRTLGLVHHLGYGAIGWTVDTRGWQGRQAGSAEDVVERVRAALRPGAIVLMHLGANPDDGTTFDADALPQIIATVRAAGYSFVDVSSW